MRAGSTTESVTRFARGVVIIPVVVLLLAGLIAAPGFMLAGSATAATPVWAQGNRLTPHPAAAASSVDVGVASGVGVSVDTKAIDGVAGADFGGIACGLLSVVCGGDDDDGDDGDDGGDDGGLGDLFLGGFGPGDVGNVIDGLENITDPFAAVGSAVAKAAATAWTAAMLAIWSAGLLILRLVLTCAEWFLTPDLRPNGPGHEIYQFSLWAALGLAGIMVLIQLGLAAFKREGKTLARAVIGSGQFVLICACWFSYCVLVVAACGAITRGLMRALLGINSWPEFDPLGDFSTEDMTDVVIATALGALGLVLVLAAMGHFLVYLARAAALMILTSTGPIAAAGLVSDAGRPWFWKTLRWFHAAAFTPVLMVLVLGIGVQFASGAMVGMGVSHPAMKALGTAIPAVMIILIHLFAPLALFKLFAFADPGTPSGASFRQGMAAQGGLKNLLSGGGSGSGSQASAADSHGRSAGESGAEAATAGRFAKSLGGLGGAGGVGLAAGQGLSRGLGMLQSLGAKSTSLMSDVTNQAGIGHHTYGPDFSDVGGNSGSGTPGGGGRGGNDGGRDDNDGAGADDAENHEPPPAPPAPPAPSSGPPPQLPPGTRPQGAPPGPVRPGPDHSPPGEPPTHDKQDGSKPAGNPTKPPVGTGTSRPPNA